jgi:hypothetical protein
VIKKERQKRGVKEKGDDKIAFNIREADRGEVTK